MKITKALKELARRITAKVYAESASNMWLRGETSGALWDKYYWETISKKYQLINQLKNTGKIQDRLLMMQKIQEYENIVERNYNDQTVVDERTWKRLDAEQVAKAPNTVTNDGMTQIALLSTKDTNDFFEYYAYGVGTTMPELTDLILEQEVGRVSIKAGAGYHGGAGTSIKHSGIFAQGFPSADVTENAAFTQPDANSGVMLFRTVFSPDEALHHEINSTFFTLSHIIYMSSI